MEYNVLSGSSPNTAYPPQSYCLVCAKTQFCMTPRVQVQILLIEMTVTSLDFLPFFFFLFFSGICSCGTDSWWRTDVNKTLPLIVKKAYHTFIVAWLKSTFGISKPRQTHSLKFGKLVCDLWGQLRQFHGAQFIYLVSASGTRVCPGAFDRAQTVQRELTRWWVSLHLTPTAPEQEQALGCCLSDDNMKSYTSLASFSRLQRLPYALWVFTLTTWC